MNEFASPLTSLAYAYGLAFANAVRSPRATNRTSPMFDHSRAVYLRRPSHSSVIPFESRVPFANARKAHHRVARARIARAPSSPRRRIAAVARPRTSTRDRSRALALSRSRARRRRASPRRRRPSPRPVGASVRLARSRARRVAAASRRAAARSRRDRRIRARPRSRAPSSVARRSRARDGPRAMASSACGDGADVATARDARSRTRVKKQIILARCAVSRHVNVRDFFYLFPTRGRDGGWGLVAREGVDGGCGHSETG